MISVGELISIFSELSTKNKKRLYTFLYSVFSKHEEEYKEIVDLLTDLKEDLLYSDEIDEKEENEKLYFTQDDLAIMTGLSKRQVQRILKSNNIEPLNPGQKPLFYDLNEFEKYYFIAKNTFREQQEPYFTLEDFSVMFTDLDIDTLEYLVKDLVPKVVDGTKTYSIRDFINVYKKKELK